ncbi:MAG: MFS transporter [Acidobacteria bacterium]|nr:MFS transporter [Acidobacteriota bacterium]
MALRTDTVISQMARQAAILEVSPPNMRESFRALRHRDFRLYATGQLVSLAGTWMQSVAQSWLMYRLTKSEWLLGLTVFATHAPVLLLSPLGGWAVDHFPRRRVVAIAQTLAIVQAVLLAWLTYTNRVTTTHVLLLSVWLGVLNAFDIPGRQSLFVGMVGKADLISAISLNSAIFNASRIIGPSLAGIVVAAFGEAVCFLINGFSFVAMVVCLLLMNHPERINADSSKSSGMLDGFHYFWERPQLRTLFGMSALMNLGYGPMLALMPFFADGIFHKGSQGLGVLIGAMGFGAVIGVVGLASHKGIGELPSVVAVSTLAMGFALTAFALSTSYYFSLAVMPVIGYAVMRQNAGGNSLTQSIIPDEYRGRMTALYSMVVTGALPFSSLAAGFLASRFGPRAIILAAAIVCLAGAVAFRFAMPGFRKWVKEQEEVCAV